VVAAVGTSIAAQRVCESIRAVLATIPDPEMPISIVDLGIVADVTIDAAGAAQVTLTPTFIGCPALDMLTAQIRERVAPLPGVQSVDVRFVHEPRWSAQNISPRGREELRRHGVVVGDAPAAAQLTPLTIGGHQAAAVQCPFCGSPRTSKESDFGPTRCRMIYYCDACRNSFERMKDI
jgi:ring-1,2-phenylacetyl-CoA epoxidase subunit PaaD